MIYKRASIFCSFKTKGNLTKHMKCKSHSKNYRATSTNNNIRSNSSSCSSSDSMLINNRPINHTPSDSDDDDDYDTDNNDSGMDSCGKFHVYNVKI